MGPFLTILALDFGDGGDVSSSKGGSWTRQANEDDEAYEEAIVSEFDHCPLVAASML